MVTAMNQEYIASKARIIKANHLLQNKVGIGEIEDSAIQGMQKIIDTTTTDFVPLGLKLIEELAAAVENAKSGNAPGHILIEQMAEPVMQIKGNAAMFHYELVSTLADLVLNVLENTDSLDSDLIDLVDAHQKSLAVVLNCQMSGTGGKRGAELEIELQNACRRFYLKKGRTIPDRTQPAF